MSEIEGQKIAYRFLDVIRLSYEGRFDRFFIPALLFLGVGFSAWQAWRGDWILAGVAGISVVLLVALTASRTLQRTLIGQRLNHRHATLVALAGVYSLLWVASLRAWSATQPVGKNSQLFYILLILIIPLTIRLISTLYALTINGYRRFITQIPLWELFLVAVNEIIAMSLLAFVGGTALARLLQPDVFTVRVDALYSSGLVILALAYYFIMQMMWFRRWNDWLSQNRVWVNLARLFAPIALLVISLMIFRNIVRLSDRRAADLLGAADIYQAILALAPIAWVMILFIVIMVFTGGHGLRRRFLPENLLELLPERSRAFLSTVSDMDILLLLGFLSTSIPIQLFLLNSSSIRFIDAISDWLDSLREQIVRENALIDSSEQIVALFSTVPFYLLVLSLLGIYASVLASPTVSAREREDLVRQLPIRLLILFIVILYLCAIPFSQILVEGHPQSFGNVIVFDFVIPLILIYGHYFAFVRLPYGRGQNLWRESTAIRLDDELSRVEKTIDDLDEEITLNENRWLKVGGEEDERQNWRIDLLHKLVALNGKRDRYNMRRLQIVAQRQALAEISETPISGSVSRLPVRILTIGIPILFLFKIYYDGLLEIVAISELNSLEDLLRILVEVIF